MPRRMPLCVCSTDNCLSAWLVLQCSFILIEISQSSAGQALQPQGFPAQKAALTILSRQQGGAEGSNLDVLLHVGPQRLDSPPRKCSTKHCDTVRQKRRCGGLENTSTGDKIHFHYFVFKTQGCVGGLGFKSFFSSLSDESPSETV